MDAGIVQIGLFVVLGVAVGVGASFSGLGGGFLMAPAMLLLGLTLKKR